MADYYLAAAGDDTSNGSYTTPWKTITRLNTAFLSGLIGLGDRIFLNRGDTFYGRMVPPGWLNPSSPGWLHIGAYGSGPQPIISGYKLLNIASGWTQYDATTWQIDYSTANVGVTYTGFDSAGFSTTDTGFLKIDGVIHGVKRFSLATLANQWEFYSTGTTLYVHSSANPTTLAADIHCAVDDTHGGAGVTLPSCVELVDLMVTGHAACGISHYGPSTTRTRVLGCTIAENGGALLSGAAPNTRCGNGMQVWSGATDFHGEGNIIRDIYDTAYTIQYGTEGVAMAQTNIMWRRNLTYRCSQAAEYDYLGTGPGYINCVSEYNTDLFSGYGWGAEARPDAYTRVGLLSYNWEIPLDLTLRYNIYYDCRNSYSYHDVNNPPNGLVSDENEILLRPGTLMQYGNTHTIEQAAAWAASVGREQHSRFTVLPSNTNTAISDADVSAAIADLDSLIHTGQHSGGGRVMPIHTPWRGL